MALDMRHKPPECFFCGASSVQTIREIVRAKDETPEEAQRRPVCYACHPNADASDLTDGYSGMAETFNGP
jgi:hypothetical protein